ncbi:uroporphyrinogen-III C-methyltransferase [Shewanella sp. Isolate11]|uniref:uroporphyrinogen-III C-methyltransferase n=1 Tax=Shewanella sp. Isolate11 TaxID=2908530 RepID=UPI001EFE4E4E|nr:uroporphyrinogen-III C-methyltransferase [Shewanella sp. Isolate11]MCG9698160.1 uroporphyrinogen-III C-methyltransferase [Shewanella sp. Isolate11]
MRQEIIDLKRRDTNRAKNKGKVSLVGAGPGDADLLTVKALTIIQSADLIIYDRLVSDDIRALFPASTPALYVGKAKSLHSVDQSRINEVLVEQALLGKHICRLKGGDGFIFGRGGEEVLSLKQQNIAVEVVPGITAASGCSTYAGIPLTHRGLSQGCTFVTAHAETDLNINWQGLALLNHTLVFYMGLSKAGMIATELMQAGLDSHTPVALIERGCSRQQRLVKGEIANLAELVIEHQLISPTLILVGEVVNLSEQLSWFESQVEHALDGKMEFTSVRMSA